MTNLMKKPKIHSQVGLRLLLAFIASSAAALLCFWIGQYLIRNQQIAYLRQLHDLNPVQQASNIQQLLQAYNLLPFLNMFIAWAVFGSILFGLLYKRMRYLQTLAKQTSQLPENSAVPEMPDELYALSHYIGHMHGRIRLLEEQALQQQQQREAMLAYLSAYLRTPLALVRSAMDLSMDRLGHAEKPLQLAHQHVLGLEQLVGQLFEYAYLQDHPELVTTVPIDLVPFTQQQLGEWSERFAAQGRILDFPHAFQQCRVKAQEGLLSDLFRHLLDNALRHAQGNVSIGIQEGKDTHTLYVENAFEGSAPQTPYLFEHDYLQGGGLGLPIAKLLADKMGASIEAQVQGQRFRVCIHFGKA